MRGALLFGMLPVAGCIAPGHFVCAGADDCGAGGRCVAGSCVVPDATCPSLERYSKYAEEDLAGICFEGDESSEASSIGEVTSSSSTTSSSSSDESSSSSSSSGEPIPVEICNNVDDNGNGLIDEWSIENDECVVCPPSSECKVCDLFPDDEAAPTRYYYMCHGANYDEVVSYCEDLGAPAVSIHDDAENTFLAIKVAAFAMYKTAYIGLRDFGPAGAPMWTWVDGSEFDYERLGADLDVHGKEDVCAAITSSSAWEAAHCYGGRTFICEAALE